jgi:membrane protein
MKAVRAICYLMRDTIEGWTKANGTLLAAGLAYYAIFSLAPLLVIAVSVAGLVFSEGDVTEKLVHEISITVNPRLAFAVQNAIESHYLTRGSALATSLSVVVMLIGASILFVQVKRAINLLWGIAPQPGQGLFIIIRTQFLSFVMVLVIGVLLVFFMVVSTVLVSLNQFLDSLPHNIKEVLPEADFGLIFLGFILLFALIFKILPDAKIAWRDVWFGAALTSVAFTVGEYIIGFFLGETSLSGIYRAAGSVFLILVWVYYSMQILLFGAKFTQVYANRYGSKVLPSKKAALIIQNLE